MPRACGRAGGTFQHPRPLTALPWSRGWGSVRPEEDSMRRKRRAVLSGGSFRLVTRKNSLLVRRTPQCRLSRGDELPVTRGVPPPAGAHLPVQRGGCTSPLLRSLLHSDAVSQSPPMSYPCGRLFHSCPTGSGPQPGSCRSPLGPL